MDLESIQVILNKVFNPEHQDIFVEGNIYDLVRDFYAIRKEYDANGRVIYEGISVPGTPEDEWGWMIKKYEYDENGNLIAVKFAEGVNWFFFPWSDRALFNYL